MMSPRFSIRYKFLAVTTLLLALCVGTYLLLASYIFKEDKKSLVFDYNRSLVVNLSSELETFFQSVTDKMQLVAHFHHRKDKKSSEFLQEILLQGSDIVWMGSGENLNGVDRTLFQNEEVVKTYGLSPDFLSVDLFKMRPIPFADLRREGEAYWNATADLPEAPALVGVARTVIEEDHRGVPVNQFAIFALVRVDRLLKSMGEARPNEVVILGANGETLVHPDPSVQKSPRRFPEEQYQILQSSDLKTQVLVFEKNQERFFGAYSRAQGGRLIVFANVPEAMAFGAVNDLVSRSVLFGSILVTFAFMMAILFSRSLTRPIEVLVGGMSQVSKGDLNTRIEVSSKDEIASLANSFNQMIQDLKASRAELEEINQELEHKVRERTKQLEERNVAVKEAQEALLRSTRLAAVGEVAGLAAHEVLNPLTSMISRVSELKSRVSAVKENEAQFLLDLKDSWEKDFAEGGFPKLVQSWEAPSKVLSGGSLWQEDLQNLKSVGEGLRKDFDTVIRDAEFLLQESQRISRIVNSFRSLSSVKADVKVQPLHAICEKSVEIMADLAAKHNISIVKKYEAPFDEVVVDEDEVIQVLTNLLRNSIQAIVEGEGTQRTIELSTRSSDHQIEISISDTGCGISDENKKKLFNQKFTTKSKEEGTGIGLSLSRRLIRAFKGDIHLERSQVGQGSTFVVRVPLAREYKQGRSA